MKKELYILRGLPGSGKSTLAKNLAGEHFETDKYFIDEKGEYKFDISKIKEAHSWCQKMVEQSMCISTERIVISNTFTQEWEFEHYIKLAKEYGYMTFVLIVENRHEGTNIHNVPLQVIKNMKNRFEIKL